MNLLSFIRKYHLYLLLLALMALLISIAANTEGSFGGADSYVHYRISKYSWKYPHLFLDNWGKPLFTLFSSPFSQFGYQGLVFFNMLCGLTTGLLIVKILRALGVAQSWIGFLLLIFTPLYLTMLFTGLTEVFFGLALVLSLFYFVRERFATAAIIVSFLPFARSEGLLLLGVFALALLLVKQYRSVALLGVGMVIYSVVGYFHFEDWLWVLHSNPYTGAESIYGSGEFWSFVREYRGFLELPLSIFFLLSIPLFFYWSYKRDEVAKAKLAFVLLVFGCVVVFFFAHSFLWWQGMAGSLGLVRVMTCIIPLMVIMMAIAANEIIEIRYKIVGWGLVLALLFIVIREPFKVRSVPNTKTTNQVLMTQAVDWLQENGYGQNKIIYFDPYAAFLLDQDPWDQDVLREKLPDNTNASKDMVANNIVIWDAHFGNNEGQTPLAVLTDNPEYELLRSFAPKQPYKVLGDHYYEIHLFKKKL